VVYCSNVGDSTAVLVSDTGVTRLSYDHKGSDTTEVARVQRSGGFIMNDRVGGSLAITRALGDHSLKA
jgi:serine/threonine protein phosphatase PrpC